MGPRGSQDLRSLSPIMAKSKRIKRKGDFMYACKNEENAKMKIRTMNRNNLKDPRHEDFIYNTIARAGS